MMLVKANTLFYSATHLVLIISGWYVEPHSKVKSNWKSDNRISRERAGETRGCRQQTIPVTGWKHDREIIH